MKGFPPCKENHCFVKGIYSITQNSPCIFKSCGETFFASVIVFANVHYEETLHIFTWKLDFVFLNQRYTCIGYVPSNPF